MTLIRLIRAMPDPALTSAPQVLGVDEFALRRGHRRGSVLVDVEARWPVDILPERSADSLAAGLAARPGTQARPGPQHGPPDRGRRRHQHSARTCHYRRTAQAQ
jgi:hypothetical protein